MHPDPAATTSDSSTAVTTGTDRRSAVAWMLAGLALGTAVWWIPGWRRTGHVPYVVDDAWIHLTIVRNLRDHGTFGVVPGVYESASSAPLWNLLLTPLSFLPVPMDWWPIVVNLAAAGWILWRVSELPVVRRLASTPPGVVALVVLPVAMGLPQIAATGMEHLLQAAVALELLRATARAVDGRPLPALGVAGLAFGGTLIRFETTFLVAASCVAVVIAAPGSGTARLRLALPAAIGSATALAVFGLVNTAMGQSLLPNSVLAKSAGPMLDIGGILENLGTDPFLLVLAFLTVSIAANGWTGGARGLPAAGFAAAGATVLHLLFADVGNFSRYQEWLVVLMAWAALANVRVRAAAPVDASEPPLPASGSEARTVSVKVLVLAVLLFAIPKVALLRMALVASEDIHLLQEQTARFLDRYHDGDGVGLHDLGWVAWLHDGSIVDLAGLATHDITTAIRDDALDAELVGGLFASEKVAVVATYDGFFDGILPAEWEPAGTWCVRTPVYVLSADCFTFYGRSEADRTELRDQLAEFRSELPDGVTYQPR